MTRAILALALLACAPNLGANRTTPGEYVLDLSPATAYTVASYASGCPEWVLQGIAFAESSERDDAIGDGGESIGRFQLREIYHETRAARWGEYDPRDPTEAGIIAGFIVMDALDRLGNMDDAIAAYRQGVSGVLRNGPTMWYVERVRRYGNVEG